MKVAVRMFSDGLIGRRWIDMIAGIIIIGIMTIGTAVLVAKLSNMRMI